MRKVAANASGPSACGANFARRDKDFTVWEMRKTAIMIHVQVSEDNLFHIARSNAERTQLWAGLLFRVNLKHDLPSQKRMKRIAGFEQMRSLASVDHDDTFRMLDRPRRSQATRSSFDRRKWRAAASFYCA